MTEYFLNLTAAVSIDKSGSFKHDTFEKLNDILTFYSELDDSIPDIISLKFQFVHTLVKLRIDGKTPITALDSAISSKAYKMIEEKFVDSIVKITMSEKEIVAATKQINEKQKKVVVVAQLPSLSDFVRKFENNDFKSSPEAISEFIEIIKNASSDISRLKRSEELVEIKSMDVDDDNYDVILDSMSRDFTGDCHKVSTGFSKLDEYFGGGFEPARLYMFAGASGDGKSTLLNNFILNNISTRSTNPDGKKSLYVYITLENLIGESFNRLYCSHTEKTMNDIKRNWSVLKPTIKKEMHSLLKSNNTCLRLQYFKSSSVSALDICDFIDNIKQDLADDVAIRAIYIDYLDLLKSGKKTDMYRIELGQITTELKSLAVEHQVPVITVTQVNRSGYVDNNKNKKPGDDNNKNKKPVDDTNNNNNDVPMSLTQLSESIKKVENSDVICMIRHIPDSSSNEFTASSPEGQLKILIAKQRNGPKDQMITLKTNFSKYKIYEDNRCETTYPVTPTVEINNVEINNDDINNGVL